MLTIIFTCFSVHMLGYLSVSIIHQTPARTTGPLTHVGKLPTCIHTGELSFLSHLKEFVESAQDFDSRKISRWMTETCYALHVCTFACNTGTKHSMFQSLIQIMTILNHTYLTAFKSEQPCSSPLTLLCRWFLSTHFQYCSRSPPGGFPRP